MTSNLVNLLFMVKPLSVTKFVSSCAGGPGSAFCPYLLDCRDGAPTRDRRGGGGTRPNPSHRGPAPEVAQVLSIFQKPGLQAGFVWRVALAKDSGHSPLWAWAICAPTAPAGPRGSSLRAGERVRRRPLGPQGTGPPGAGFPGRPRRAKASRGTVPGGRDRVPKKRRGPGGPLVHRRARAVAFAGRKPFGPLGRRKGRNPSRAGFGPELAAARPSQAHPQTHRWAAPPPCSAIRGWLARLASRLATPTAGRDSRGVDR